MSEAAKAEEKPTEVSKVEDQPDTKRQKMSVAEAPDSEWPEAWLLPEDVKDQCALNKVCSSTCLHRKRLLLILTSVPPRLLNIPA